MRSWFLSLALVIGCVPGEPDPPAARAQPDPEVIQDPPVAVEPDPVDAGPVDAGPVDSGPVTGPVDAGPGDPCSTCWRSELFPGDWTPAHSLPDGRFLHDFSYAGYAASERPIPQPQGPIFHVEAAPDTDRGPSIQAAIDAAGAAGGGVVELGPGLFRVDGRLLVTSPGTLIRGAGPGVTELHFTEVVGMSDSAHLTFRGAETELSRTSIAAPATRRDNELVVDDATAFSIGDEVLVGWTITDAFLARHQMDGLWAFAHGQHRDFFRRTVIATGDNALTLDVPIRYDVRLEDEPIVRAIAGHLVEVGLADLSIANANARDQALEETRVHAVLFDRVKDAWVQNLTSFSPPTSSDGKHFISGGIKILRSRRVTVQDSTLELAQHRGGGGNGYLFELSQSNEILYARSTGRDGRHNFIQNWDFGTSGVVWLDCESSGSAIEELIVPLPAQNETHHALAMANLIDGGHYADGWLLANRKGSSSGAGHTATETTLWNVSGGTLISFQFGEGYLIGTDFANTVTDLAWPDIHTAGSSGTAPEDTREGEGQGATLSPSSLFQAQLATRLAD